jgi:hypothetical protein
MLITVERFWWLSTGGWAYNKAKFVFVGAGGGLKDQQTAASWKKSLPRHFLDQCWRSLVWNLIVEWSRFGDTCDTSNGMCANFQIYKFLQGPRLGSDPDRCSCLHTEQCVGKSSHFAKNMEGLFCQTWDTSSFSPSTVPSWLCKLHGVELGIQH